jgi:hypothetical protein
MSSMSALIFSLLILVSCGKHEQASTGKLGERNINQVQNSEVVSQYIIEENLPEIEKYLVDGGEIEFEFKSGRTLLTEACFWTKFKVITLLIKHKADVERKDRTGKSALDYGEENIEIKRTLFPVLVLELKKRLLEQASKNLVNEMKKTLEESPPLNFLITAEEFGPETAAAGETFLTFVVKHKLENVLRLIAQPKYQLDVNMKNAQGESPLVIARALNFTSIEKVLIKLGATE